MTLRTDRTTGAEFDIGTYPRRCAAFRSHLNALISNGGRSPGKSVAAGQIKRKIRQRQGQLYEISDLVG